MNHLRVSFIIAAISLIAACRTLSQTDEAAADAFKRANEAREKGQLKSAVQAYNEALSIKPGMAAASFNLALTHAALKEYAESQQLLLGLLDRDPQNLQILRALAYVNKRSGNLDAAFDYYRAALDIFEGDRESLRGIVEVLIELDEYREALEYQEYLVFLDESMENRLKIGEIFVNLGDLESALNEYRLAFNLSSPKPQSLIDAAEIAEEVQLLKDALSFYLTASKSSEKIGTIAQFRIARLNLLHFFNYSEGFTALEGALSNGFDDEEALEDLKSKVNKEILPSIVKIMEEQAAKNSESNAEES